MEGEREPRRNTVIAVLGGDARQAATADALAEHGFRVITYGVGNTPAGTQAAKTWNGAVDAADAVLLPMPVTEDGTHLFCPDESLESLESVKSVKKVRLSALFSHIPKGIPAFGGRFSPLARHIADTHGVRIIDYFERDSFQIRNALPTAEGAIFTCMRELDVTVQGCRAAVVGYGRIGKLLAGKLSLLGARVTVAARSNADLARIRNEGLLPLPIRYPAGRCSLCSLGAQDVIFNTVPCRLFDDTVGATLGDGTLYVELASVPGGIDPEECTRYGVRYVRASGLPGKYAPRTAGRMIAEEIVSMYGLDGEVRE